MAAPGKRAPNIVFRPVAGERVVVAGIGFGSGGEAKLGPRNITLIGMQTARKGTQPAAGNQYGIFVGPGSRFIRLVHMDAGSVDSWFADHLTVAGGDYGPCSVIALSRTENVCGNNKLDVSTNVVIDGATFHDLRFDRSCFQDGADCHWECMYINAGKNVTIRRSRFRDCALFDIFSTISGPDAAAMGHQNLTIENNWFDTPWDENPRGAQRARAGAVVLAWCGNSPHGYRGVRVRFNSFQRNTGIEVGEIPSCVFDDVQVTANLLMYSGTCDQRVKYAYNRWSSDYRRGRCGATDRIVGASLPYVNPRSGSGFDFHLVKRRSTAADNAVPASAVGGCPGRDFDRQRRPQNATCDAGSDERRLPR